MKPQLDAEVQIGAISGAVQPRCRGAIPYIGNALCIAPRSPDLVQPEKTDRTQHQKPMSIATAASPLPILPRHPADLPGTVRILLSRAATDALAGVGPHLCIATYAPHPQPPEAWGRGALTCLPISLAVLSDIMAIVAGTATVRRTKTPKASAATSTPTAST